MMKVTGISDRSETWRAVTASRDVEQSSFYHTDQRTTANKRAKPVKSEENRAPKNESEAERLS